MLRIKIILLAALSLFLFSCSITKKRELKLKSFEKSNLVESIINENTKITNLIISYNATLTGEEFENKFNGQIRIAKDSAIWINVSAKIGIEIGRALFTKNDFRIMIPSQKIVYDGSYSKTVEYIGSPLDFNSLQYALSGSILAVESLIDFQNSHIDTNSEQEIFFVSRTLSYVTDIVIDSYTLKPKNIKITKSQHPINLELKYKNFITIDKVHLPQSIEVITINNKKKTTIEITYKKIESSNEISIPFKVPAKFEIKRL